jgi:hypothetical protein
MLMLSDTSQDLRRPVAGIEPRIRDYQRRGHENPKPAVPAHAKALNLENLHYPLERQLLLTDGMRRPLSGRDAVGFCCA